MEPMTTAELIALHDRLTKEAKEILTPKVRNYSGGGDAYTNFRRVEDLHICSMENGILARISDKIGRLITHCNHDGLVGEESFEDSIIDTINYLVFLHGCVSGRSNDGRS